jgi:hypothetical protein
MRAALLTVIALVATFASLMALNRLLNRDDQELYTEDWAEAREFARNCEHVRMIPHWRNGEDTPYAATIICRKTGD